jgi:hypothetical protein
LTPPPRPPAPVVDKAAAAASPITAHGAAGSARLAPAPPAGGAAGPRLVAGTTSLLARGTAAETALPGKPGEVAPSRHARTSRGGRLSDPAKSQPIYSPATLPKGLPTRPAGPRRPGEPRPMHPTASRPVPGAGGPWPRHATYRTPPCRSGPKKFPSPGRSP